MVDLPIALALLAVAVCTWLRPWVGVLGWVFVGVMNPQSYAAGWLQGAPVYLATGAIVGVAVLRQWLAEHRLPAGFWDWRFAVAALLGLQMLLSTWLGINPWAGWSQLGQIAKMLPLLALVLLLIDDRDKLRLLLLTIALSITVVVLKGGFWALFTGFQDRVYGPPNSQYHGNNEFAVVVTMAIPLLVLWLRQAQDRMLRLALCGLIALSFAAALSSWSRGALLCVITVALLLVAGSQHKGWAWGLIAVGVVLAWAALPGDWFDRMQTLSAPAGEASAASRLEIWRIGWAQTVEHPWFGSGLGGWIYLSLATGGSLAWHSAYVGMAAEHGFVGLALWVALLFGSIVDLSWIARHAQTAGLTWLVDQAAMLRASLAAYAVGSAFLSIAYWELLYLLIAASILTRRMLALEIRRQTAPAAGPVLSGPFTVA